MFIKEPVFDLLYLLLSDKDSIRRKKEDPVYQAYFCAK